MEISSAIKQSITIIEGTFGSSTGGGNKVEIVSEMYRLEPDEHALAGRLGCDILITPNIEGCESVKVFFPNYLAEEIAWNPMGQLVANEFVWETCKSVVQPFMD